jgi:branched-chain amino acid aminotransferase
MRKVWWNGNIIPESDARISIYDDAFMFGSTVFEMTRSFNKVHFKLREHLERLYKSAKYVRIEIPYNIDELEEFCNEITEVNQTQFADDDEYRLMIDVTRGLLPRYQSVGQLGTNVIISIFPLRWATQGLGKYFDTGVPLVIPSQRQIPSQYLDPKIKHRSRLHFRMALNETDWPILLDDSGYLTEGPGYNFFISVNGQLYTPPGINILRGISREYIFSLDGCFENLIQPYDVFEADEAFITGTPFCMLPVTSLNGIQIGDGKVGPVYKDILKKWSQKSGIDIKRQIQLWDERPGISEHRTYQQMQQEMLDVRASQTGTGTP